jgi:hypothetical protein
MEEQHSSPAGPSTEKDIQHRVNDSFSLTSLHVRGALLQSSIPLPALSASDQPLEDGNATIHTDSLLYIPTHLEAPSRSSASLQLQPCDQDYAILLNANILLLEVSSGLWQPVMELTAHDDSLDRLQTRHDDDDDDDDTTLTYFVRVPCHPYFASTKAPVLHETLCLAQQCKVTILQTLLIGGHQSPCDYALLLEASLTSLKQFCEILQQQDFVLDTLSSMPVV